nr:MAG TPA: hypothetical protein [Caudoviricetes sp.]
MFKPLFLLFVISFSKRQTHYLPLSLKGFLYSFTLNCSMLYHTSLVPRYIS